MTRLNNPVKSITELTYDELVSLATQRIHLGLLEGGGRGLHDAVHVWLSNAILWGKEKRDG